MNAAPALSCMSLGVVVERRRVASAWIDYNWRPVVVLPGRQHGAPTKVAKTA